ncbi:cation diffusion facilitator family transporter [Beijerinckia indica]|uniref:Cation diffusion facilitator family transporter n=1 Tax=Beijerinckia indica subsp. indica (strain ATCC 9039 / DSM 1715 / NCIMB 8712) TaxID=395963 RepID=B2IHI2_BEII9|nr:cation diffusion facilitator family transporter [Beijerinckia indica]ACB94503.1 cation diffusion facilitator family transporter [Beijerinckia indica subsp. indica ATCC 9039]
MQASEATVPAASSDHFRTKERAALISVGVKSAMTIAKFIAGLASGSLALMSETANNFSDILTSLMTFVALRIAHQPADETHQYGHAKVEALAALIQMSLLFAFAAFILIEAVRRLLDGDVIVNPGLLAFSVLIISLVVDLWRWRSLHTLAKTTKSHALAAEALNFLADAAASCMALLGLGLARAGFPEGDALAALMVAGFIGFTGYQLGRRTIDTLLDAAPQGLAEKIRVIVAGVPGVIKIGNLRLRPLGHQVVGDMNIFIARTLPLEKAAAIKANVLAAVTKAHPDVSLTMTMQPIALGDETMLERILLIAAKRHIPIHHVTVQEIDGKTSVGFDVELDGAMAHGTAHEIVSGLEGEIARELGPDIEVESHIEPLMPAELPGQDAPAAKIEDIKDHLIKNARLDGAIFEIHNVRVRETPAGLVINYHCRVDPDLPVGEVHRHVDELDHGMRSDFADISRIIGHAEPLKASLGQAEWES